MTGDGWKPAFYGTIGNCFWALSESPHYICFGISYEPRSKSTCSFFCGGEALSVPSAPSERQELLTAHVDLIEISGYKQQYEILMGLTCLKTNGKLFSTKGFLCDLCFRHTHFTTDMVLVRWHWVRLTKIDRSKKCTLCTSIIICITTIIYMSRSTTHSLQTIYIYIYITVYIYIKSLPPNTEPPINKHIR